MNFENRRFCLHLHRALAMLIPVLVMTSASFAQVSPQQAALVTATGVASPTTKPAALDTILATAKSGEHVILADLLAELQRAPLDTRKSILSRKEMVEQLASNLLQRRVLANQALKSPLSAEPVTVAAVQLARERVLSDVELASHDARNLPADAALDAQVRGVYLANQARFERPTESRAKHILISTKGNDGRAKAQDLLKQLRDGASFEDLAKLHSQDPGSAAKGGDLGFFGPGAMVKTFEDAVNKLQKVGDLSDVVETEFGFHIIRLEERREKGIRSFEEVADQLRAEVRAAILRDARTRLSQDLVKSITVNSNAVDLVTKSEISF